MSGPVGEGPLPEEERNVVPPADDGESEVQWHRRMAKSGSHWVLLNCGHFDPSRGRVEGP